MSSEIRKSHTEMSIRFIDGVSESNTVNELFRYISIYEKN